MVGVKFSRIVERKSAELALSLVGKLKNSPRTPAYCALDSDSLKHEYECLLLDLTDWLVYRSPGEIEARCLRLGKTRAIQGVPLEECVSAMLICKEYLIEQGRQEAGWRDVELFGELEFVLSVNQMFDDVIFFCMKGHMQHSRDARQVA